MEGVSGAMVPASDPVALADAIEVYLRDPALRQRHGDAGRKRVELTFGIDEMVNKYVKVYESVFKSAVISK